MRLRRILTLISLAGFSGLLVEAANQTPSPQKEVTYTKDIAPILNKNCVVCHRPNDVAPMSLMTYQEVLPFAPIIQQDIEQRKMPPWHADPNVGEFINDPRLSDTDIATIKAWVKGGRKEGNPKDLPPTPVFEKGWHFKPDIVFTIPSSPYPRRLRMITNTSMSPRISLRTSGSRLAKSFPVTAVWCIARRFL